jgi:hypothetical protein
MTDRSRYLAAMLCLLVPLCASAQTPTPAPPAPLTVRLGSVDFRFGGFLDAEVFVRSTNVGSGLGTTFGTIPFDNTPQANLSETRLTAQGSRFNLLVTTTLGNAAVKGFVEVDFLGNGPGNAFVYTNAHTPRMRHGWAQYARRTVTGSRRYRPT